MLGIVAAVVLAVFTMKWRGFPKDTPLEVILWVFLPAIVGARLYFLIFNGGPWGLASFEIWNGGLAIYGAVIGGAIGAVIYCWVRKKNFLALADVAAPSLILGQGIGRLGCYAAGCCYGEEAADHSLHHFPLGIEIDGTWHLATMLYESFFDIIICVVLVIILSKVNIKGIVLAGYMILYGTLRAIIEGFRGESLMLGSIRVSQLLSIIIIAAGIALLVWRVCVYVKEKKRVKLKEGPYV